jgi:anti-repressor protein
LDDDEKGVISTDTHGGTQNLSAVNEPGLYALVLGSRKQEARAFKRWITHDVVPSIRQHGMYATPATVEAMLSDPDTMIKTLQALKDERNKRLEAEKLIEEQKPLVEFAQTCQASADVLHIGDFAKVLCKNGFNIGRTRLFQWLRDKGIFYRENGRNLPYQEYVDREYFEISETTYHSDGEEHIGLTTMVTPKGQLYLMNKLVSCK